MAVYTVLADALTRAKDRSQRSDVTDDDAYLTELLEMSAGTDADSVIHYRPFYCAARLLEQDPDLRDLATAGQEAEFTLAQPRIIGLMALQLAYDTANSLVVPPGFEAVQYVDGVAVNSVNLPMFSSGSVESEIYL